MQIESFFPYRLAIAAESFSRRLATVYGREFGLSREEWRMLFLLRGGAVNSAELGRRTTLDKVQVSRAGQRLEDRGLITRRVLPADRRLREFRLTEAGRALFDAAFPEVEDTAAGLLDRLAPEDRAALMQGLDALMAAMECLPVPPGETGPPLAEPAGS
ncbi:MarR family winged helix-turn-helix transcriptional regulator [Mangrovicoccus ximenensis]|uniref:MarR family winged helix-turn-helix transcriptional regulator n=1 Tax=Mangrovicoccus ximenensis TaxID=1911570 RepID=UPI000D3D6504|nr:MarR family transcriptional regulator [Mangrovicoccus ximenensis]